MLGATDTTNIATVELARFLLPSRWQESVIGMFGAYFDESGTGTQSPMMAVAGFVARSSVWTDVFEPAWRAILDREGVSYFHMTDFENYRGEYTGWERDRHERFIKDLITVIRTAQPYGVGMTLDLVAFRELESELRAVDVRKPYHLCAQWCVALLLIVPEELKPVAWMFEEGAEGTGDLKAGLEQLSARLPEPFPRISPLAFGKKQEHLPLQAADLLAYEIRKQDQRTHGLDLRLPRRSIIGLLGGANYNHGHLDRKFLVKLIADIRRRGQS